MKLSFALRPRRDGLSEASLKLIRRAGERLETHTRRTESSPASQTRSRCLDETIDRFEGVKAVFHGHAHRGRIEGRTASGVQVYNVSRKLLDGHKNRECEIIEV